MYQVGGGNLKFLHLAKEMGLVGNFKLFVIADRECDAEQFAIKNKIPVQIVSYLRTNNLELKDLLKNIEPDLIITNWHKIIDAEIVNLYRGKIINLHYSLLPAFSGLIGMETVKQAYTQNCQYVGVTCHFVDEGVDTGKIIAQAITKTELPIEDAIQEVFENGCLILLNSILGLTDLNIEQTNSTDSSDIKYSPPFHLIKIYLI